jgi:hypothetical protein
MFGHASTMIRTPVVIVSMDQISTTVATVLSEYFKSSERTMFWNDDFKINVDPFEGMETGFFATDWDFKVRLLLLLRQHEYS